MLSNSARVTSTLMLAALLGCRSSTEPDPLVGWLSPTGCNGRIDVTVTSGVVPTFSWTPNCGISALTVTNVTPAPGTTWEAPVWGFSVPENHPLGPTVRYGAAPAGANLWTPARPLDAGTTYRVSVMLTVGLDVAVASGSRTFVP